MKRTTLAILFVLACGIFLASGAFAQGPQPSRGRAPEYAPDVVLVKFRQPIQAARSVDGPSTGNPGLDRALTDQGVRQAERLMPGVAGRAEAEGIGLDRIYRLRIAPGQNPVEVAAALSADPNVEYAEPDYTAGVADAPQLPLSLPAVAAPAATIPNDPLYPQQWGLAAISAAAAWDVVTGTPAIVIAVIDSGIDTSHPDLASNLWVNPGEIPGNGIDDDNDGYVDDVQGWNFVSGSNDISDGNGHGTQVAGIIAAATNNGIGMAGLCWNCRIMPVRVMGDAGTANYSDIAAGVTYAAAKGASVINLSLGGYADSRTLRDAISAAMAQGVVVVGGVGNDNVSTPFYPAAYSNVLAVAGTTITDNRAAFSNYGAWVDVSAPAVNITTTFSGGDWGSSSGTSLGAPFASGLAALVRSHWPAWTESAVRLHLERTADNIDALNPGYAGLLGSGRLNAATAMVAPRPVLEVAGTAVNGDPLGRPVPGLTSTLAVTLRNDWADAMGTTGSLSTSDPQVTIISSTTSFGDIVSGAEGTGSPAFSFAVASGAGWNHAITFTLAVTANAGAYTSTVPLIVATSSGVVTVTGALDPYVTWTSDKTYVVNGNVLVSSGYTLTIQPGTQVRFSGSYTFSVAGTLIADGSEALPIVFRPYTPGGAWNRIHFRDSSVDALVDADGNYQGGTILRHVQVLSATNGLSCAGATPYFSHLTTTSGGINCTLGAGDFWLVDSNVTGAVSASGRGHVWRSATTLGSVTLGSQSEVLTSTIGGGVSLGDSSTVRNTWATGAVGISGAGSVSDSSVSGVSMGSGSLSNNSLAGAVSVAGGGTIAGNIVTGSVSLGSGQFLTNTVRNGGLVAGGNVQVQGNDVEGAPGTGIATSGTASVIGNRVVGSGGTGVTAGGGLVQGNLIANGAGVGLDIGSAIVLSNTLTGNRGSAVRISTGIPVAVSGNNLEGNKGPYDVENRVAQTVNAAGNWWGTTDGAAISQRVYDNVTDGNVGLVPYSPPLTGPVATAPAYVRAITMTPESPVGIETAAFDLLFSRTMDRAANPAATFYSPLKGTWRSYNTANSGLAGNIVGSMSEDVAGNKWFGTAEYGVSVLRADGSWRTYNSGNSGLSGNRICDMFIDANEDKWFGTCYINGGVSVLRADGSWQTYNPGNSGLAGLDITAVFVDGAVNKWFGTDFFGVSVLRADGSWQTFNTGNSGLAGNGINAASVDSAGNKWFSTCSGYPACGSTGISMLGTDANWQTYNVGNSGLANNLVYAIAFDYAGNRWFGTSGGVSVLGVNGSWQTYNTNNSGLADSSVLAIAVDAAGNKWFGTSGGVSVLGLNGSWQTYNTNNSRLANNGVRAIAVDTAGNKWFGTLGGVSMLYGGADYPVGNEPLWQGDSQYRASYGFSTLVPRGAYSLTVSAARGADGIQIAPYSDFTFTVDYAGAITDQTPPTTPRVLACGTARTDAVYARWWSSDAESRVNLYEYAIGTAAGKTDVVNWTTTPLTSTTRVSLTLNTSQAYYVSVKARNEAGLWSAAGASGGVMAGRPCAAVYLPLVVRNYP